MLMYRFKFITGSSNNIQIIPAMITQFCFYLPSARLSSGLSAEAVDAFSFGLASEEPVFAGAVFFGTFPDTDGAAGVG